MKRILFVDDETEILEGLRNLLRRYRKEWDMVFVDGAEPALAEIAKAPFDIVISDMRMPGMDGADLLGEVRSITPRTIRIILSGFADTEASMRALSVAHQFISKPCTAEAVQQVIERAMSLRDVISEERMQGALGDIDNLPAVPKIYNALVLASDDPNSSAETFAEIIGTDPAMAAKLLQVANSAFMRTAQPVAAVEQAVVHVGMQTVVQLALAVEVFRLGDELPVELGLDVDELQQHGLATGQLAAAIADGKKAKEYALTAGLLHDVGKLVMAWKMPDRSAEVIAQLNGTGGSRHEIERRLFGVTHAEIGAYLLGVWGLPQRIVEAVAFHHNPRSLSDRDLGALNAVHFADALLNSFTVDDDSTTVIDKPFLEEIGVVDRLSGWHDLAQDAMDRCAA